MGDIFTKTMKWFFCSSFFVLGVFFFYLSDYNQDPKPIILGLFSFGVVYWLSKSFYELPKKLLLTNFGVLIASAVVAHYVLDFGLNFFIAWYGWLAIIGIPVMAYTFTKT